MSYTHGDMLGDLAALGLDVSECTREASTSLLAMMFEVCIHAKRDERLEVCERAIVIVARRLRAITWATDRR